MYAIFLPSDELLLIKATAHCNKDKTGILILLLGKTTTFVLFGLVRNMYSQLLCILYDFNANIPTSEISIDTEGRVLFLNFYNEESV